MAISPKNEEQLEAFEAALTAKGERLDSNEIAEIGASTLGGKKLTDGLRASIYIERIHQKGQEPDWDELIPVSALMETFRGEL